MRIGIYGGSFDPVHIGHLLVAESVRDQLELDKVLWIPAYQSPLKRDALPTAPQDRVAMLKLAVGGHPQFEIDEREIRRGGVSFTIDTVRELQVERPGQTWFLLMGADSLADLHLWKEPEQLCQLTIPVVVARGGEPEPNFQLFAQFVDEARLKVIRRHAISMRQIEISSRDLRDRIQKKRSIRYQVPASVEAFIHNRGLYQTPEAK